MEAIRTELIAKSINLWTVGTGVRLAERTMEDVYYTLDGRKLEGKPTAKGMYIVNGRKVIIK